MDLLTVRADSVHVGTPGRARHDTEPTSPEREPDLTLVAMVGFVVGVLLIGFLALWATRDRPQTTTNQGLLSAVPGSATFEVAALHALEALESTRPTGTPNATEIESWSGSYLEAGIGEARSVLASHAAPVNVQAVRDSLVSALDRYIVASGAAESCLAEDLAACRPQLTDLRNASSDVDRLAGDLRLYLFG